MRGVRRKAARTNGEDYGMKDLKSGLILRVGFVGSRRASEEDGESEEEKQRKKAADR